MPGLPVRLPAVGWGPPSVCETMKGEAFGGTRRALSSQLGEPHVAFSACPCSSRGPLERWQDLIEGACSNPFFQEALEKDPRILPSDALEGDVSPRHM